MITQDFLTLLAAHQEKALVFEYAPNKIVGANYHITEIKNITVDAVDCGTGTDFWKETIIQLWESPKEIGKTEFMTVYKALSIIKKVNRIKPMENSAEIKFEYGNDTFHTAQLFVSNYKTVDKQLRIQLSVQPTDCKAKDACGIPEVKAEEPCCTPDGNCC